MGIDLVLEAQEELVERFAAAVLGGLIKARYPWGERES